MNPEELGQAIVKEIASNPITPRERFDMWYERISGKNMKFETVLQEWAKEGRLG